MVPFKLQDMLGPEQVQNYDGLYGQGPPSVHSSHGGRQYQQPGKCSTKAHCIYTNVVLMCKNFLNVNMELPENIIVISYIIVS